MVGVMEAAWKAAGKALENTYEGVCTIVEYRLVKDGKTRLSGEKEVTVARDLPCRLSFEKISAAVQTETAAVVSQGIKLFLSPETEIKGNSKIIVTQNGVTEIYSASSKPAVYPTHQEIMLVLFRGWA